MLSKLQSCHIPDSLPPSEPSTKSNLIWSWMLSCQDRQSISLFLNGRYQAKHLSFKSNPTQWHLQIRLLSNEIQLISGITVTVWTFASHGAECVPSLTLPMFGHLSIAAPCICSHLISSSNHLMNLNMQCNSPIWLKTTGKSLTKSDKKRVSIWD